MIDYIIQVLLFQVVFLAIYDFILKKETFFQWNRAYLIFTSLFAYIIPLLKFERAEKIVPQEYVEMLPEVILSPSTFVETQLDSSTLLFEGLHLVFFIGIVLSTVLFIYKIKQLFALIYQNKKEVNPDYNLIFLKEKNTAFSFFNYIFIGKTTQQKQQIITHELVHVKQKHSIDLLLFEIQKIVFWFNPFSYIYQNRISEVHEFIADSKSVCKDDKSTYFQGLLAEIFQVEKFAFINSFNKQSFIKKRIMMLSKKNSKEILKFKYLLLIPILMGMMIYTSCKTNDLMTNEKRIVSRIIGDGDKVARKVITTEKEGYFDSYLFGAIPDGKEINISDLSVDEKLEYETIINKVKDKENRKFTQYKIFELDNGNRVIQEITDWKGLKKSWKEKDYSNADVVPFSHIDQVPVFPGCENADNKKECYIQNVTTHVNTNFNTSVGENLGLEKGKEKVYVQFTIDKTGNIVNIRSRAAHKDLQDEAIRVIASLPQMQPGEHNGKKVGVKYTLPIVINID